MGFVNRDGELKSLTKWWGSDLPSDRLAFVWGRRRVGKSELLSEFVRRNRLQAHTVFHVAAGRPAANELRLLSQATQRIRPTPSRDLNKHPFVDWDDALTSLAGLAVGSPLLLVLDEFPELLVATPEIDNILRASLEDISRNISDTKLRIVLCGSAVRTMEELQQERSPLFGRAGLRLQLHPFAPSEASAVLTNLEPSQRAMVWGLLGGVPLYLTWWDQTADLSENLEHLVCNPRGPVLTEADYLLATEARTGSLPQLVLRAIAGGRTKYQEITDTVGANPTRTLEALTTLRLIKRMVPITENPARTKRSYYEINDNFLAFTLGLVDRYRSEIDQGLGPAILPVLIDSINDYMGARWEEAYRQHLRRLAANGDLGPNVVAVGPYWELSSGQNQIDAVVLAGRSREAVLIGEAKWAKSVNGTRVLSQLQHKEPSLPKRNPTMKYSICARDQIQGDGPWLPITAADIFD